MAAAFRAKPRYSSSDDSDSSDDEKPWKRKCDDEMKVEGSFLNPLAGKKPPKFKNNVWSTVLTDQAVSGELGSFDIVEDEKMNMKVNRGPESFRVTADAVKTLYGYDVEVDEDDDDDDDDDDDRERDDKSNDNDDMVKVKEKNLKKNEKSKSKNFIDWDQADEMEADEGSASDGNDDFLAQLEKYKKAKVEFENKPKLTDLREKIPRNKRKNDLRNKVFKNREARLERENVGRRHVFTSDAKFQTDIPRALGTDTNEKVLECLLATLQEGNRGLFSNIVEKVDNEKIITVLNKTEDVENAGGMMINSGHRRRTPGGVFIQLLKADSIMTEELTTELFPLQEHIKFRRKDRKKKKRNRSRRDQSRTPTMEDEETGILTVNAAEDMEETAADDKKENGGALISDVKFDENIDAEDGEIVSD